MLSNMGMHYDLSNGPMWCQWLAWAASRQLATYDSK